MRSCSYSVWSFGSKFFEHFIQIVDAMNNVDGNGLWDDDDGFYYDILRVDGASHPLRGVWWCGCGRGCDVVLL